MNFPAGVPCKHCSVFSNRDIDDVGNDELTWGRSLLHASAVASSDVGEAVTRLNGDKNYR